MAVSFGVAACGNEPRAEAEGAARGDRSFLIVDDLEELGRRLREARDAASC